MATQRALAVQWRIEQRRDSRLALGDKHRQTLHHWFCNAFDLDAWLAGTLFLNTEHMYQHNLIDEVSTT